MFTAAVADGACLLAETAYAHTTPAHRAFIAHYTACFAYIDDLGARAGTLEDVSHFTRRFARGEPQPDAVLDALAGLLRRAHDLWGAYSADAIVAGTLDAVAALHVERAAEACTLVVRPGATRFPGHLRERAGIGAPYAHFAFGGPNWEDPGAYAQVIP